MGNSKVASVQHFDIKSSPSLPMWLQETYVVIVAALCRSIQSPTIVLINDYTNVVLCQKPLASLTLILHTNESSQISPWTWLSKHKLQKMPMCSISIVPKASLTVKQTKNILIRFHPLAVAVVPNVNRYLSSSTWSNVRNALRFSVIVLVCWVLDE